MIGEEKIDPLVRAQIAGLPTDEQAIVLDWIADSRARAGLLESLIDGALKVTIKNKEVAFVITENGKAIVNALIKGVEQNQGGN